MHTQIQEYGYTLILDEVIEVIEPIPVSAADQKMLTETGKICVDEDGRVRWKDPLYKGRFEPLKRMANSKTLFCMEGRAYLWRMPVDMLRAFEEAYVLTFLFEGSHMKHYLDIHGIPYDLWHVEDAELVPGRQDLGKEKKRIRGLLEVYDGRLNALGEKSSALSKSWWQTNSRTGKIKVLEANTYSFLRMSAEQHRQIACGRYSRICGASVRQTVMRKDSVPDTVESIAEDAFSGCEYLTLMGSEGSYVQEYAEMYGYYFKAE